MKITTLVALGLLAVTQAACGEEPAHETAGLAASAFEGPFLNEAGIDTIRINEPLPPSVPLMQPEEYGCGYARTETPRGPVYMMTIDGKVARVEVGEAGVTLENGLGIGNSEAEIVAIYGDKAVADPNKYDEQGTDYQVKLSDTTGLIFNASEGKVAAFRVGRYPELEWVEGCS